MAWMRDRIERERGITGREYRVQNFSFDEKRSKEMEWQC